MSSDERILMGVVGAPHGVRGELRLKSYTADPMTIGSLGMLWTADGRRITIVAARPLRDDLLVVRLKDVDDRDAAAALTNRQLFATRRDLPAPGEEEFYHTDLIGLPVETTDGVACGRVLALQNFGAGDLLEIVPPAGDTFLVAFTKAFVPVVDVPGRRLVLAAEALPGDQAPSDPEEPG